MCDDHPLASEGATAGSEVSRRDFLHGTAAMAAAAGLLRQMPRLPLSSPARPTTFNGTNAYSMAMHIHSSFSEKAGSMQAQLSQAAQNAVDVLWWTDHDWRMDGYYYRDVVHFTSLTQEAGAPGQGGRWIWQPQQSGQLLSHAGGVVASPATPHDPAPHGSLFVSARSAQRAAATFGFYANSHPADFNYRDNLTGQSLSIDVLLQPGWSNGYLELAIGTSYHEASAGRPAGHYGLSYQIVPAGTRPGAAQPNTRAAHGNTGVITIPVIADGSTWATVTITPSHDIASLWPDLDYRDFALYNLSLNAVSSGAAVSGYFGYLRFSRNNGGSACVSMQQDMMRALAPKYPSVMQQQGLEVSWHEPHVNWFGPGVAVPGYADVTPQGYLAYAQQIIGQAHAAGGLVSYNHPYGTTPRPRLNRGQQDKLLKSIATRLLSTGVYGCDILEAGYHLRAGVDLAHHVALWDVMSRNGVFLTGIGVSDDHAGTNWYGETNNWTTCAWAASTGQQDLISALHTGRSWCGSLSGFRGNLDLLVDGRSPMGSVSVSAVNARQLTASASGIPARGSVQVLQGDVDYAGTADLTANTKVVASYPAGRLHRGWVTLPVDTNADCFVRTQVLDSAGAVVGLSNPVWLLRRNPPGGVPAHRGA